MGGTLLIVFFSSVIVTYLVRSQRRSVAPYVATPKIDRSKAFELLDLKSGTSLIELGCGKGDFLFDLAKLGIFGTGVELSFPLFLFARIKSMLFFENKVKILYGDLFEVDLSDYNRVYMYLMKGSYPALKKKFTKELKPGSRVLVAGWPLDDTSAKHKIPQEGSGRFYSYDY